MSAFTSTAGEPALRERMPSNMEIVVLALYALGGEGTPVSTEDIAVRANAMAPGRFTWKTYPDQINLEHVRVFLADAKKDKNGRLVGGGHGAGWLLSDRGLQFAKSHAAAIEGVELAREPISNRERLWRSRERARIENVLSEKSITKDTCGSTSLNDAEAVFRLDEYVAGEARARIVYRYLTAFADDAAIGPIIRELADKVRED